MKKNEKKQGTPKLALEEYIQRFGRKMRTAEEAFAGMAREYAAALKAYPRTAHAKFAEAYPQLSSVQWALLRLIGNGGGNPRLMWLSDAAAEKVLSMRKQEQDKFFSGDKGVEVYVPKTGATKTVPYSKLKNADVHLVVDAARRRVRSVEEQRECVERANENWREHMAVMHAEPPYKVDGDVVEVLRRCRLGQDELRDALVLTFGGDARAAARFVGAGRKAVV